MVMGRAWGSGFHRYVSPPCSASAVVRWHQTQVGIAVATHHWLENEPCPESPLPQRVAGASVCARVCVEGEGVIHVRARGFASRGGDIGRNDGVDDGEAHAVVPSRAHRVTPPMRVAVICEDSPVHEGRAALAAVAQTLHRTEQPCLVRRRRTADDPHKNGALLCQRRRQRQNTPRAERRGIRFVRQLPQAGTLQRG